MKNEHPAVSPGFLVWGDDRFKALTLLTPALIGLIGGA
jgi:hypothetical protein